MAKYTRKASEMAADDRQDSELLRHMTPAQKAAWKKADAQMDSMPMTRSEDEAADKKLAAKIKRTVR